MDSKVCFSPLLANWHHGLNVRQWLRKSKINPWSNHTKYTKMVLDASLRNTRHYKVRIKGKQRNPEEGVNPSPTAGCCIYWKGSNRGSLDYGWPAYYTACTIKPRQLIYPSLDAGQSDSYILGGNSYKIKHKHLRTEFEQGVLIPFPKTETVAIHA